MTKANYKLRIACEALERIAFPIKAIQKHLKEGEQLNGQMAYQLSNDPQFLKDIAKEALNKLGQND
ncbi:MAG: hypothetical protein EHM86_07180 [Desulfobulbaceae bacterium]|nr:MAG: hypothetical protein EHM86_07180 [Desulfobulbaceae bacterium]